MAQIKICSFIGSECDIFGHKGYQKEYLIHEKYECNQINLASNLLITTKVHLKLIM